MEEKTLPSSTRDKLRGQSLSRVLDFGLLVLKIRVDSWTEIEGESLQV